MSDRSERIDIAALMCLVASPTVNEVTT